MRPLLHQNYICKLIFWASKRFVIRGFSSPNLKKVKLKEPFPYYEKHACSITLQKPDNEPGYNKKKNFLWQEYPGEAEYTSITETLEKQKQLLQVGIKTNS